LPRRISGQAGADTQLPGKYPLEIILTPWGNAPSIQEA
jgi:hypothetical protein